MLDSWVVPVLNTTPRHIPRRLSWLLWRRWRMEWRRWRCPHDMGVSNYFVGKLATIDLGVGEYKPFCSGCGKPLYE